jgi:hypothetical protein
MDEPDALIEKKSKNELMGKGCLVQGLGLLMPFIFGAIADDTGIVIGIILLLVLLVVGSRMSTKWLCEACMNPLPNKEVKMCPTCKENFK